VAAIAVVVAQVAHAAGLVAHAGKRN
jgi:hypothetical protein